MAGQATTQGLLTDREDSGRLPVSVQLHPASIERTAAMLHIVYAHTANPAALDTTSKESNATYVARHHREAMRYLQEMLVKNDRVVLVQDTDGVLATYTILAKGDQRPLKVIINPTVPVERCLAVQAPNGTFVPVDFSKIAIVSPASKRTTPKMKPGDLRCHSTK